MPLPVCASARPAPLLRRTLVALSLWAAAGVAFATKPEIDIDGVDGKLRDNVRLSLSLSREACDTPRWRVQRQFRSADGEVDGALRAFGHYHAKLTKRLEFAKDCWSANFQIDPGEPVRIQAVDVEIDGGAKDDSAFADLLRGLPLKPGDILIHGLYEQIKSDLTTLAAERGYLNGQFTRSELRVDPEKNSAVVRLRYASGPRYRFGELRIHQKGLDEDLIQRILRYPLDTFFDSAQLTKLHQRLTDSGYFSRVKVRQRRDEAVDGRIPVDVELDLKKRHRYSAGAGFSTDIGPNIKLGYEQRRVNPRGHRLTANLSASPVSSSLAGDYQIPLENPQTDWLTLQAGYQTEDTDSESSDQFKLAVSRASRRPSGWLRAASIEFLHEESTIGEEDQTSTLLMPGVDWSRIRVIKGDSLYPKLGYRANFGLRGSDRSLGSDTAFLQLRMSGKGIWSPHWLPGRFISRAELGVSLVGDFDVLPASQRFFAGGDNSVRGYGFKELGPEDAAGDVTGGKHLVVGSIEYEHPIRDKWSVAGFVDTGNALDNFADPLKTAIGLGIRWRSPIGPIRVDLAHPLDDPDTAVRLHISMGPDL